MLRVTCTRGHQEDDGDFDEIDLPQGLQHRVAGTVPLCQNLVTLHLRCVELMKVPALPLLAHLILEGCTFQPALVASLQGLARLETLHMSGSWGAEPPEWDVRACTRLRRVCMSLHLAADLASAGRDLRLPSACTVSLGFPHVGDLQWWLARLGWRVADLRLVCYAGIVAHARDIVTFTAQLSQLKHLTMILTRGVPGSLCVARLLGALPRSVESLHLDYPNLSSEQAVVAVPASLRALRIRGVCDRSACSWGCLCEPSERTQDLCFGLHAGLERLQLVLWHVRVGLQCLGAGAPAGLQDLNVQARGVDMDDRLVAEVGQRGRVLERCDVFDSEWVERLEIPGCHVPPGQVVHIGQGQVQMEYRISRGRVRHWACTCGTCAECLGPEAFGGVEDVWY